jgi:tight adherence protein B
MIVRSLRSGYHLNAALAMVADNTPAPLGTELRRVVDETTYGWSLLEAINRLGFRIDAPDVRFFTVVLAVQQETGGNLSEVLGNLASIIRKRKHLRMKIRALSSEGRATAWILGLLPVMMTGAIYYVSPQHLQPLITTFTGNVVVAVVLGLMTIGMLMVRQIIRMDI